MLRRLVHEAKSQRDDESAGQEPDESGFGLYHPASAYRIIHEVSFVIFGGLSSVLEYAGNEDFGMVGHVAVAVSTASSLNSYSVCLRNVSR